MEPVVAVMQPYAFPYAGYFCLLQACDTFVFYDDVHYKPRGWINRNRVLIDGREHLFTIPVRGASQNERIDRIALHQPHEFRGRFLKQLEQAYRRAPQFDTGMAYVDGVLGGGHLSISELAIDSVERACRLLGLERTLLRSSSAFADTRGLGRAERLAAITRAAGGRRYVNSAGGQALYERAQFSECGVELLFVEPELQPYAQTRVDGFVAGLSIIDVLMHCSVDDVARMLRHYRLKAGEPPAAAPEKSGPGAVLHERRPSIAFTNPLSPVLQ